MADKIYTENIVNKESDAKDDAYKKRIDDYERRIKEAGDASVLSYEEYDEYVASDRYKAPHKPRRTRVFGRPYYETLGGGSIYTGKDNYDPSIKDQGTIQDNMFTRDYSIPVDRLPKTSLLDYATVVTGTAGQMFMYGPAAASGIVGNLRVDLFNNLGKIFGKDVINGINITEATQRIRKQTTDMAQDVHHQTDVAARTKEKVRQEFNININEDQTGLLQQMQNIDDFKKLKQADKEFQLQKGTFYWGDEPVTYYGNSKTDLAKQVFADYDKHLMSLHPWDYEGEVWQHELMDEMNAAVTFLPGVYPSSQRDLKWREIAAKPVEWMLAPIDYGLEKADEHIGIAPSPKAAIREGAVLLAFHGLSKARKKMWNTHLDRRSKKTIVEDIEYEQKPGKKEIVYFFQGKRKLEGELVDTSGTLLVRDLKMAERVLKSYGMVDFRMAPTTYRVAGSSKMPTKEDVTIDIDKKAKNIDPTEHYLTSDLTDVKHIRDITTSPEILEQIEMSREVVIHVLDRVIKQRQQGQPLHYADCEMITNYQRSLKRYNLEDVDLADLLYEFDPTSTPVKRITKADADKVSDLQTMELQDKWVEATNKKTGKQEHFTISTANGELPLDIKNRYKDITMRNIQDVPPAELIHTAIQNPELIVSKKVIENYASIDDMIAVKPSAEQSLFRVTKVDGKPQELRINQTELERQSELKGLAKIDLMNTLAKKFANTPYMNVPIKYGNRRATYSLNDHLKAQKRVVDAQSVLKITETTPKDLGLLFDSVQRTGGVTDLGVAYMNFLESEVRIIKGNKFAVYVGDKPICYKSDSKTKKEPVEFLSAEEAHAYRDKLQLIKNNDRYFVGHLNDKGSTLLIDNFKLIQPENLTVAEQQLRKKLTGLDTIVEKERKENIITALTEKQRQLSQIMEPLDQTVPLQNDFKANGIDVVDAYNEMKRLQNELHKAREENYSPKTQSELQTQYNAQKMLFENLDGQVHYIFDGEGVHSIVNDSPSVGKRLKKIKLFNDQTGAILPAEYLRHEYHAWEQTGGKVDFPTYMSRILGTSVDSAINVLKSNQFYPGKYTLSNVDRTGEQFENVEITIDSNYRRQGMHQVTDWAGEDQVIDQRTWIYDDPKYGDILIKSTPVTMQDYNFVSRMKVPDIEGKSLSTWPRLFEDNLGKGALHHIWYKAVEAQGRMAEMQRRASEHLKRLEKVPEEVGYYLLARQPNGLEIIKNSGYDVSKIPSQLPKGFEWVEPFVRNVYDKCIEGVNKVRTEHGMNPIDNLPDYFTFMLANGTEASMGNYLSFTSSNKNIQNFVNHGKVPFHFEHARKGEHGQPLNPNVHHVVTNYYKNFSRFINLHPYTSWLVRLTEPIKVSGHSSSWKMNDKAANMLLQFADAIRNDHMYDRNIVGGELTRRLLPWVRRKTTGSTLGASARTVVAQNIVPIVEAPVYIPYKYIAQSMQKTMTAEGVNAYDTQMQRSSHLRYRTPTPDEGSFLTEYNIQNHVLHVDNPLFNLIPDHIKKRIITFDAKTDLVMQKSLQPMIMVDQYWARVTQQAAYLWLRDKGYNKKDATMMADYYTILSNASGAPMDVAPLQNHAFGKAMTLFSTTRINRYNMYKDIFKGLRIQDANKPKAAMHMVMSTALVSALFENGAVDARSPEFAAYQAMVDGWDRTESPFGVAFSLLNEVMQEHPFYGPDGFNAGALARAVHDYFGAASMQPKKGQTYLEIKVNETAPGIKVPIESMMRMVMPGVSQAKRIFWGYHDGKRYEITPFKMLMWMAFGRSRYRKDVSAGEGSVIEKYLIDNGFSKWMGNIDVEEGFFSIKRN